jgi:hypothetical protein
MTVEEDAILIVDYLGDLRRIEKWVPYRTIADHFGWGQGSRFHRRLTEARKEAHARDLALSYAWRQRPPIGYACKLTASDAGDVLRAVIPRARTVATYHEGIGRHGSFIASHGDDAIVRTIGELLADDAASAARKAQKLAKLVKLLGER